MTEDELMECWCPKVAGQTRDGKQDGAPDAQNCVGSKCAWFRRSPPETGRPDDPIIYPERAWCGIAGEPTV